MPRRIPSPIAYIMSIRGYFQWISMADRLFVSIGSHDRKDRVFLEMPMERPAGQIVPDLVKVLEWKEFQGQTGSCFALETEDGRRIPATSSLPQSGVRNSDLLFIIPSPPDSAADDMEDAPSNEEREEKAAPGPASQAFARNILSQPHFIGPSGVLLLLGIPPLIIGRAAMGQKPDINLSEWDRKKIASRRHAVLEKVGDHFALKAEKTTNGTYLNGKEMEAGEVKPLNDGDRICCGFHGVELVFRNPQDSTDPNSESDSFIS
jgi:pSer/pThr/pTyr-binding forkhead associated (FHA) protein